MINLKKRRKIIITIIIISIAFSSLVYFNNKREIAVKFILNNKDLDIYYSELGYDISDLEKDLNVKRIDYSWNYTLTERNIPKNIVFHHADASILSPEQVNELHKEKGWSGIGYHYYIRKDGTIYSGRPEESMGSHVYGNNDDSIGICVEGNYQNEYLNDEQYNAIVKLSVYLILKYNLNDCLCHRDLNNTLCPGENFPIGRIKNSIYKEIITFIE